VSGVVYYVQRSTNLSTQPPFVTIKTNLNGLNGVMTNRDNAATGPGPYFYRVGVQ